MTQLDETTVQPLAGCPALIARSMDDARETLRSKSIINSDILFSGVYKEQSAQDQADAEECLQEHIGFSLPWANGPEHRSRRKLLNQLVRPDALDAFRDDVIVPQAARLLPLHVEGPGEDGQYRLELVAFCDRVFLDFSAKMIGFVGIDTDEQIWRLRECVFSLAAATTSLFYKDRTGINAAAKALKQRYVDEFYFPSLEAAKAQLAEVEAGTRSAEDVPKNFMTWVASGVHPTYQDEHQAIVESIILFTASVATSTQSIVNTVNDLSGWLETHPEDYARCTEHVFMLNALQESLRLWAPFTPFLTRMAVQDMTIGDSAVLKGQEIRVPIPAANRDKAIFGADSKSFNPFREVPEDTRRYGIAFGVGEHQCLGLRVVVGSDGTGGAHVRLLQLLFEYGVRPDPLEAPTTLARPDDLADYVEELPRFSKFPAVMADWKASTT